MHPLLECQGITKQIGQFTLSDICFCLEPGYILGVVGRNGAGKSTLLRVLLGSYLLSNPYDEFYVKSQEVLNMRNSRGDVLLGGASIKKDTKRYKEQIAFVLNESPFDFRLSAWDNGRLYGHCYKDFQWNRYAGWLSSFEVPAKVPLYKLSKGEQLKQQLAFALSYEAKLYIFDEPTGNLDVAFRKTFYQHMRQLTAEGSKSVIYVSHLVEEMEQFADYLLWLQEGRQRFFGTIEELWEQFQLVEETAEEYQELLGEWIVGMKKNGTHQEMLVNVKRKALPPQLRGVSRYATLKEILYYVERGN